MPPLIQAITDLQRPNPQLSRFGLKVSPGGSHNSRTMMLEEITRLLALTPPAATFQEYGAAVMEQNVLGKNTESTRRKTFRYLRELYGLSASAPLFALYRELVRLDAQSAPLLSLLVAWARDPLLRATSPGVLSAGAGVTITKDELEKALQELCPNQYGPLIAAKIARNAASTWTQSGHLAGHGVKIRCRVQARPAALTLALILGDTCGWQGQRILESAWCQLLDLSPAQARSLAAQAHREGLIDMKAIGSVVEITFPRFRGILETLP